MREGVCVCKRWWESERLRVDLRTGIVCVSEGREGESTKVREREGRRECVSVREREGAVCVCVCVWMGRG